MSTNHSVLTLGQPILEVTISPYARDDPITPGTRQGKPFEHQSASHWYDSTRESRVWSLNLPLSRWSLQQHHWTPTNSDQDECGILHQVSCYFFFALLCKERGRESEREENVCVCVCTCTCVGKGVCVHAHAHVCECVSMCVSMCWSKRVTVRGKIAGPVQSKSKRVEVRQTSQQWDQYTTGLHKCWPNGDLHTDEWDLMCDTLTSWVKQNNKLKLVARGFPRALRFPQHLHLLMVQPIR